MKQTYKSRLKAVIACMAGFFLLVSCQNDDERLPKAFAIATHVNGYVSEDGKADTRGSINGTTFSFSTGDAIGVIALRNGSVMNECNNVRLTYRGGTWSGADIYDWGADKYIAYYPYRSDMAGKTSVDAIKSAFPIQNDQSTEANFNASNLMTATATVSGENLSFNFTPAFAMVEVVVPEKIRGYSNGSGEKLTYDFYGVNSTGPTFNLKFWKIADRTYRRIIKPSTSTEVKVSYNLNGKKTLNYTKQVNVATGTLRKIELGTLTQNISKGAYAYRQNGQLAFLLNGVSNDNIADCFGVVFVCNSSQKFIVAKNDAGDKYKYDDARDGTASSAYQNTNPVPGAGTSGWFLPSRSNFQLYNSNQVDGQLVALGDKGYGVTKNGSGKNKKYHYSDSPVVSQIGVGVLSNDGFTIATAARADGNFVRFFCSF